MKTLLRQISLVMSLVLLFGAVSLMSSCRKEEGGEGESKAPETTESTEPIVLSSGGKAVYRSLGLCYCVGCYSKIYGKRWD